MNSHLTDVLLLKLSSQMALDKCGLANTTIADKQKLKSWDFLDNRREKRVEIFNDWQCAVSARKYSRKPQKLMQHNPTIICFTFARIKKTVGKENTHHRSVCVNYFRGHFTKGALQKNRSPDGSEAQFHTQLLESPLERGSSKGMNLLKGIFNNESAH